MMDHNIIIDANPLVSIILITYNRKELLKETIESILAQTYTNYELIVVDNYSDYDFMGLIDFFHSEKIQAYQNHNYGTIAINRNFGITKAKGDYLAFCDDDDLWMPNKLELQMKYMLTHNVDMISTAITLFGEKVEKEKVLRLIYKNEYDPYLKNVVTPSTVLLKNGPLVVFDENPVFNCGEDYALWLKLYIKGYKLYQMPDALVKYRISGRNLSIVDTATPQLRTVKIFRKLKHDYGREFKTKFYLVGIAYRLLIVLAFKLKINKLMKLLKRM